MIKVLSAKQVRSADQYTITHEPIKSIDLMERASEAFVKKFITLTTTSKTVAVVCGPGNNGGDGFAIARILKAKGYKVNCYDLVEEHLSEDCSKNRERFLPLGEIHSLDKTTSHTFREEVIIDGILGSGLSRPVTEGKYAEAIRAINLSDAPVFSIDIPSGLFADEVNLAGEIIKADYTISFECPKLSFLIPETGSYVGQFFIAQIGLDQHYLKNIESEYMLIEASDIRPWLKRRDKFAHKGTYGRVQIIAGSQGKMGAAFLCGKACLMVGAGLLIMNIPAEGNLIIQTSLPEAMTIMDSEDEHISRIEVLPKTKVFCLGPGLGTHVATKKAITEFLMGPNEQPLVLDADALNIIAENPDLISRIPKGSILTPHAVEFERLFGQNENSLKKIELMRSFSQKTGVIVVSKGAHTVISDEEGRVYFNSSGNPGMATAGSGDVLAGMITGLLAQGMDSIAAAVAGVFLHGTAGDIAVKKVGEMSLMASDLLYNTPETISNVQNADII